jgi:hypothetical protein
VTGRWPNEQRPFDLFVRWDFDSIPSLDILSFLAKPERKVWLDMGVKFGQAMLCFCLSLDEFGFPFSRETKRETKNCGRTFACIYLCWSSVGVWAATRNRYVQKTLYCWFRCVFSRRTTVFFWAKVVNTQTSLQTVRIWGWERWMKKNLCSKNCYSKNAILVIHPNVI